jgi:hypothetical protein
MSLRLYQIIENDKGEQLFKFPKCTLLDDIPLELWENILKHNNLVIYVGYHDEEYDGFRKMTRVDITDGFGKIFMGRANQKFKMCELGDAFGKVILIENNYLLVNESKCYFANRGELWINKYKITSNVKEFKYNFCHNIDTFEVSFIPRQDTKTNGIYTTFFIPKI